MSDKSNDKNFWNRVSSVYDKMFDKNKQYSKMYDLINKDLDKGMLVLEVGTASGIIARKIASNVKSVLATDFADEMVAKARAIPHPDNVSFSAQDGTKLTLDDNSFDAVIISNVLHIVSNPEGMISEAKRVLKNDGILIAPTYMWKEMNLLGKIQKFFMLRRGFPIHSNWNTEEYLLFLKEQNLSILNQETIKGAFNISYVTCKKDF